MSKRIFIGIPLPRDLADTIVTWRQLSGRSVASKNLHITLVPPWQETDADSVTTLLKGIRGQAFPIRLVRVRPGPDFNRPRLIWVEGQAPEEVKSLKLKVESVLQIQPEQRPFRLHVTLSRLRAEDKPDFTEVAVDWSFEANEFVLFESRLSPAGADYEVLSRFSLNGQ